jgi:hypothetical protein
MPALFQGHIIIIGHRVQTNYGASLLQQSFAKVKADKSGRSGNQKGAARFYNHHAASDIRGVVSNGVYQSPPRHNIRKPKQSNCKRFAPSTLAAAGLAGCWGDGLDHIRQAPFLNSTDPQKRQAPYGQWAIKGR